MSAAVTRRLLALPLQCETRWAWAAAHRCLLETDRTLERITRHGDTIGYYIPARRKRAAAERAAFREAAARLDEMLTAKGLTEDELIADLKRFRAAKRK